MGGEFKLRPTTHNKSTAELIGTQRTGRGTENVTSVGCWRLPTASCIQIASCCMQYCVQLWVATILFVAFVKLFDLTFNIFSCFLVSSAKTFALYKSIFFSFLLPPACCCSNMWHAAKIEKVFAFTFFDVSACVWKKMQWNISCNQNLHFSCCNFRWCVLKCRWWLFNFGYSADTLIAGLTAVNLIITWI